MDTLYREIFSRNLGFFTEAEQEKLRNSTVGIAGMGGVGGLLAERLIRLGIGGLKIADELSFVTSDLNCQFGSSLDRLGMNKAEAIFRQLKDINPEARMMCQKEAIDSRPRAEAFVQGCDVIVGATEVERFRDSILLHGAARSAGLHYVIASAIGFGALMVIFDPNGLSLEEYDEIPEDVDVGRDEGLSVPFQKLCPRLPSYIERPPEEALPILRDILEGSRPGPCNSIGLGLAAVLIANESVNILLRRRQIMSAPQYLHIDLMDQQFYVGTAS